MEGPPADARVQGASGAPLHVAPGMAQAGALPPPASLPAAPVDVFQAPSSSVFGAPAPAPAAYEPKGRPVQKTAAQKQALEAAFLLNQYPNEEARRALGDVIGLSEPQVNTWLSHRRRRERKESTGGGGAAAAAGPSPNGAPPGGVAPPGGAAATTAPSSAASDAAGGGGGDEAEEEREAPDPAQAQRRAEYEEVLAAARLALPAPFRPDGPPLGLEFDDIPAAAGPARGPGKRRKPGDDDPDFQMGAGGAKRARAPAAPRPRSAVLGPGDLERLHREEEARASMLADRARSQMERLETSIAREQERLSRDKDKADARMAREREKELGRLEAERRRHLERVLREQKKEEERRAREVARLRALQEKEERRLAAARERELRAEEKRLEKEGRRREREALKALSQHERAAMRLRTREPAAGPKDDLDWEWEALAAAYRAQHGLAADAALPAEGGAPPEGLPPLPCRPPFPPPAVRLLPAAPPELGDAGAGGLLSAWSFLSTFSGMLGAAAPSLDELLAAVAEGSRSPMLSELHVGLLRLLQADAEEAHAGGEGGGGGGQGADAPRGAPAPGARLLEEAWAWGFDVDFWRAHLNRLTWPEVARQVAVAAGLGRRRPQPSREERPRMGVEGEDVVAAPGGGARLQLRLPPRLGPGTVKGAAWLVLRDAGYEGLRCEEIARRIQDRKLRDLRTSKTPDASVAGALGRDVLFERIAPATYALQSARAKYARLGIPGPPAGGGGAVAGGGESPGEGVKKEGTPGVKKEGTPGPAAGAGSAAKREGGQGEEEEEEEYDTEAEEEEEAQRRRDEAHAGEPWVAALLQDDYDALPLDQRVALLCALCQLALDGPTARGALDRRLEEQQRIKRAAWDESRAEGTAQRQRRQAEAAARARAQAEEAQRHLAQLRAMQQGMATPGGGGGEGQLAAQQQGAAAMQVDAPAAPAPSAAELAMQAAEGPQGAAEREAARARAIHRAEASLREMEANAVRADPLGADRRHNRYWRVALDGGGGGGRVFVEAGEDGALRVLCTREDLDALVASLDRRGPREGGLHASLVRHRATLAAAMPGAPLALPAAPPAPPAPKELDAAAPSAAAAALPPAIKKRAPPAARDGDAPELAKVKRDMAAVQLALPPDALDPAFDATAWLRAVRDAAAPAALRRCLGALEAAAAPAALHPDFKRDPLLVKGAWVGVGREVATALPGSTAPDMQLPLSPPAAAAAPDGGGGASPPAGAEPEPLGWLPPTLSAVAMRVQALDAALRYRGDAAAREELEGYRFILRPARLPGAPPALLRGMPLGRQGRIRPTLFPPFPHRLLFAPRGDFALNVAQFEADVVAGSDALVASAAAARASHRAGGGGGGGGAAAAGGRRGRPKGAKNKGRQLHVGLPGHKGPRGGAAIAAGPVHASGQAQEAAARSDSERHYGSDFDNGEDEEDDEDDFLPVTSGRGAARADDASAGPSAAGSSGGEEEDEEEEDEEISAEEEEEEEEEGSDVDVD